MCPRRANTRTIGTIGMQLWLDHAKPGAEVDRLLDGPTHDVWVAPWVSHLEDLGVHFHFGARLTAIECSGNRLIGGVIETANGAERVEADYYVAALPVERMRPLVTEQILAADPRLAGLAKLETAWMTGAQFFLDVPLDVVRGHVVLVDSPWAVTAISQSQFWPRTDLRKFGNGRVRCVLSAIIANWEASGTYVRKPALACSAEEIREELWCQIKAHIGHRAHGLGRSLQDHNLVDWYLADSIVFQNGRPHNREPLFINTAGSWHHRPDAATAIDNLFLAADYVRTNTDLATMESANEAARRATNGILSASGVNAPPCQIWEIREPPLFRRLQELDRRRFERSQPHALAPMLRTG
jgi:uncharacterized protein with NAD-binding domain and iron-sulfur cluster